MTTQSLSRRKFLKTAGIAVGASTVACCGLGYAATQGTKTAPTAQVNTPSFHFGKEEPMSKRILVTYATRTGSTVEVATAIGETLSARGYSVDVKPIKDNPAASGYQAVLVGSAVNGAKWLPEAVEFVKNQRQELNQVPVALFSVHIMNLGDDEKSRQNRLAYLNDVRPLLKPQAEGFFAGIGMNPDEQSAIIRWVYRTFKIGPEGDCRDWDKIRGWAQAVLA